MSIKPNKTTVDKMRFRFLSLDTSYALCKLLGHDFDSFRYLIMRADYREFSIAKASGGKRTIEAPNPGLLTIQRSLNEYLQCVYLKMKPDAAFGFIKAVRDAGSPCNIVSNARLHTARAFVLNIDLKDFFHSVSADRVREIFLSGPFYFSNDLATAIALICCRNGRLPMGAATSPVVSNLACIELDKSIAALCKKNKITYTRYADDLTLSSDIKIDDHIISEIRQIISSNDFVVNEKKFRMQSKFSRQSVTGIKVNEKLNVDRRYIRNIRAILHDIKLNGYEKAAARHYKVSEAGEILVNRLHLSLRGRINFIGEVRGKSDVVYNGLRQEMVKLTTITSTI